MVTGIASHVTPLLFNGWDTPNSPMMFTLFTFKSSHQTSKYRTSARKIDLLKQWRSNEVCPVHLFMHCMKLALQSFFIFRRSYFQTVLNWPALCAQPSYCSRKNVPSMLRSNWLTEKKMFCHGWEHSRSFHTKQWCRYLNSFDPTDYFKY